MNLAGKIFGGWTILKLSKKVGYHYYWLCACNCGTEKSVLQGSLVAGKSKSCGCLKSILASERLTRHKMVKTRFYGIWAGMKSRCLDKNKSDYKYYGGRGITVCERWLKFENFLKDMFDSYNNHFNIHGKDTTIDRINNNKNYSPENCRWATRATQNNNRRPKSYGKKSKI